MNCLSCKVNKIGPTTAPYGGFLCENDHLQCNACNSLTQGQCGICESKTKFVQMNFHTGSQTLAMEQNKLAMSAVGQAPTAPPLQPSRSHLLAMHQDSSSFFPKSLFAEIETQSSLSQEHLSMNESKESVEALTNNSLGDGSFNKEKHDLEKKSLASSVAFSNVNSFSQTLDSLSKEPLINLNEDQKSNIEFDENLPTNSAFAFRNEVKKCEGLQDCRTDKTKHSQSRRCKTSKESGLNENQFLFEEDPLDSNIIHTSEIRFMDSTDSLHNFYSNSTPTGTTNQLTKQKECHKHFSQKGGPAPVQNDDEQQPKALSTKALQDFETHNTANRSEVVESYLETYGPLGFNQFPAYNCQDQYCELEEQQQQQEEQQGQKTAGQKKTVCVSTDSDPSLRNTHIIQPSKFKPQEFVVMRSVGISQPERVNITLMDKFGRPSLDMRMQKILETFQEDPQVPKIKEKPLEQSKGNYMKLPYTPAKTTTTAPQPALENTSASPREVKITHLANNARETTNAPTNNGIVVLQLLNSHRAFYNPPEDALKPAKHLHTLDQPEAVAQEPPKPQFQTIPCSNNVAQELMIIKSRYLNNKPVPAYTLNIPRSPIRCPQTNCQRMIFVSDFNKHLVVDHSHLPMERIEPFQCKNFFLDPRLAHCGLSKCHLLFLMRDTISDLGSSKYKDFLPLLVMTTKISLAQICGLTKDQETPEDHLEFFIVWVTGIVPEEFPISVSLTIWPRTGQVPSCHVVYSGEMYSIRKSQQALDVWQSGRMLLLSTQELELLTDGGREMLNLQLVVH